MVTIDHIVKTKENTDKLNISINISKDEDNLYKAEITSNLKTTTYHSLKTSDDLMNSVNDYIDNLSKM